MKITIYSAIKNAGYTYGEVADMLGITRQTLAKWNKGKTEPTYSQLIKLCEIVSTRDVVEPQDIFLPS